MPASRHSDQAAKHKRCIECGNSGHFKCSKEKQSQLIKLTFRVRDNLDEFCACSDGGEDENMINYEVQSSPRSRKRDKKQMRKREQKTVANSNLVVQSHNRFSPLAAKAKQEVTSEESYNSGDGSGGMSYTSEESDFESCSSSEGGA